MLNINEFGFFSEVGITTSRRIGSRCFAIFLGGNQKAVAWGDRAWKRRITTSGVGFRASALPQIVVIISQFHRGIDHRDFFRVIRKNFKKTTSGIHGIADCGLFQRLPGSGIKPVNNSVRYPRKKYHEFPAVEEIAFRYTPLDQVLTREMHITHYFWFFRQVDLAIARINDQIITAGIFFEQAIENEDLIILR